MLGKLFILITDLEIYAYYIYKVYSKKLDLKSIIRFIRRGLLCNPRLMRRLAPLRLSSLTAW